MFVVTGSQTKRRKKPKDVFQEYHFNYASQSLPYILKNINPNVAIVGAPLDNYAEYTAGMTNILVTLKNTNIDQLIYLSSLSVFSGSRALEINERTTPQPVSEREKTILLGEKICLEYSKDQDYRVNIIRFSEVYGASKNHYLEENICTTLCQQVINNEQIEIFTNKSHNLLYMDDAVDGLYKVMVAKSEGNEIYHVASEPDNTYLETEIMASLQNAIPYETKINIIENDQYIANKKYVTAKIQTLSFNEKYQLKDRIEELYHTIRKGEKRAFLVGSRQESILGRIFDIDSKVMDRVLPYVENIVFFVLLNLFIYFTRTLNFHEVVDVYLLYIVIASLIYGFEQSIFTIMLSVLGKIYLTIYSDISALSLVNEYMYMWILFVFAIGAMVGYLKEQYKIKYADMIDENKYLEGQLVDIKAINTLNAEVKELYESRLLNYTDSFGKTHEITSKLDLVEPQAIIFKAVQVIQEIMNTDEVSIYISSGNNNFFRLIASSADKSRKLSASLQTSEYIRIFEKMEKKEIYVNTTLDPDYPMMAGGIYKNDHLQSIVMIWSLPFESNNLYQMNVFEVTCRLIESKLNVAYSYMSNLGSSYEFKYENMLDKQSFEKTLEIYELGFDEGIVDYSLLTVQKDPKAPREAFVDQLKKNIRETDYMYEDELFTKILLTNTDAIGAQYVIDRLENDGLTVEAGERVEQ